MIIRTLLPGTRNTLNWSRRNLIFLKNFSSKKMTHRYPGGPAGGVKRSPVPSPRPGPSIGGHHRSPRGNAPNMAGSRQNSKHRSDVNDSRGTNNQGSDPNVAPIYAAATVVTGVAPSDGATIVQPLHGNIVFGGGEGNQNDDGPTHVYMSAADPNSPDYDPAQFPPGCEQTVAQSKMTAPSASSNGASASSGNSDPNLTKTMSQDSNPVGGGSFPGSPEAADVPLGPGMHLSAILVEYNVIIVPPEEFTFELAVELDNGIQRKQFSFTKHRWRLALAAGCRQVSTVGMDTA